MLKPKLSVTLSIAPKASFFGYSIAISEYPGRKSKNGRPRMILIGVSVKGGMTTKGMHKRVKKITSARSFGKLLSIAE
jgi:hypothetical protein